ncbi:hypothetical protein ABZP36_007285, partial [Zizania latifolia]
VMLLLLRSCHCFPAFLTKNSCKQVFHGLLKRNGAVEPSLGSMTPCKGAMVEKESSSSP